MPQKNPDIISFLKNLFAANSLYFQFIANECWQLKSKTINGFEQKKTKINEQTPQKPFSHNTHFSLPKQCRIKCFILQIPVFSL